MNVLEDMEVREGIKQFSEWPTIPQVRCLASLISWCTLRPVGGDESRSNCVLIVPACCMVQQLYVNGEFVGGCDIVTQVSSQQHSLVAVALARRSTLTCVCVCVCVCVRVCVRLFACMFGHSCTRARSSAKCCRRPSRQNTALQTPAMHWSRQPMYRSTTARNQSVSAIGWVLQQLILMPYQCLRDLQAWGGIRWWVVTATSSPQSIGLPVNDTPTHECMCRARCP